MTGAAIHVAHIIDSLGFGGAERVLVDIANQSVRSGLKVTVVVTRDGVTRAGELNPQVKVVILRRRARLDPIATARLLKLLTDERIDLLHVHMRSSLSFMLLLKALRLAKQPIIFHDHFGKIESHPAVPLWFRLGRGLISQYVGVYERLTQWALNAGVAPERVHTFSNTIDIARYTTSVSSAASSDVTTIVLVAALRRAKAVDLFLHAFAATRRRDQTRVLIVGGDSEPNYAEECRTLCRQLDLTTVTFLGPRSDIPEILARSQIAVLSSHSESGPLVLLEYLAAGLPIVATEVGDIGRRLARAGLPGFVPAGDVQGFTRELDAVLGLTAEARRVRGDVGRALLDESVDSSRVMHRWYELYRRTLETERNA